MLAPILQCPVVSAPNLSHGCGFCCACRDSRNYRGWDSAVGLGRHGRQSACPNRGYPCGLGRRRDPVVSGNGSGKNGMRIEIGIDGCRWAAAAETAIESETRTVAGSCRNDDRNDRGRLLQRLGISSHGRPERLRPKGRREARS